MSRAERDCLVEQIRESVYAAGLDASVPEFEEKERQIKNNNIYLLEMQQELLALQQNYYVDSGVRRASTKLKTKIKSIIGKTAGLYVKPIVADQNLYNINLLQAIERLAEVVARQELELKELKEKLTIQERGKEN